LREHRSIPRSEPFIELRCVNAVIAMVVHADVLNQKC